MREKRRKKEEKERKEGKSERKRGEKKGGGVRDRTVLQSKGR